MRHFLGAHLGKLGVVGRKSTRVFSVVEVLLVTMLNLMLVEFVLLTSLETGDEVARMLLRSELTILKMEQRSRKPKNTSGKRGRLLTS